MIHRPYVPPPDPAWLLKAKAATNAAIAAALARKPEPRFTYEFPSHVWGALKPHLLTVFKGRCAYCETRIGVSAHGDVEHFRPKGRVKEDPAHPGYYWLAFDPQNLLVACSLCNAGKGKRDQFPVEPRSKRAAAHTQNLKHERPLLLNPYVDHPEKHLEFEPGTGLVKVKRGSLKGEHSVRVYDLNRKVLVDDRRKQQEAFELNFKYLLMTRAEAQIKELLKELKEGDLEYSAALRAQLKAQGNFLRLILSLLKAVFV